MDDSAQTAYEAFQEGSRLLESANAHAAVVVLERARELEPDKGSIRETLARAYFRTGLFGLGLAQLREGDRAGARRHLKLAVAMRPERTEYRDALAAAAE